MLPTVAESGKDGHRRTITNYELAGLGRNLNQVARSLNAYPGRTTAAEREAIAKAVAAVRAHLEVAANIIGSLPQRTRARKPSA
jgi:hypothetical protein